MSIPKGFGTVVFLFKTTQAAQKVPETKKVDDGVLLVRRGNFMTQIARYPHTCFLETVENVPDAK